MAQDPSLLPAGKKDESPILALPSEVLGYLFVVVGENDGAKQSINTLARVCKTFWELIQSRPKLRERYVDGIAYKASQEQVDTNKVNGFRLASKFHSQETQELLRTRMLSNPIAQQKLSAAVEEDCKKESGLWDLAKPFYTYEIKAGEENLDAAGILQRVEDIVKRWEAWKKKPEGYEDKPKYLYINVMICILEHPKIKFRLSEAQYVEVIVKLMDTHKSLVLFEESVVLKGNFSPASLERLMGCKSLSKALLNRDFVTKLEQAHLRRRQNGPEAQEDIRHMVQSIFQYFEGSTFSPLDSEILKIISLDGHYALALLCCPELDTDIDLLNIDFRYLEDENFYIHFTLNIDHRRYDFTLDADEIDQVSSEVEFIFDRLKPRIAKKLTYYKSVKATPSEAREQPLSEEAQARIAFAKQLHRKIYNYVLQYHRNKISIVIPTPPPPVFWVPPATPHRTREDLARKCQFSGASEEENLARKCKRFEASQEEDLVRKRKRFGASAEESLAKKHKLSEASRFGKQEQPVVEECGEQAKPADKVRTVPSVPPSGPLGWGPPPPRHLGGRIAVGFGLGLLAVSCVVLMLGAMAVTHGGALAFLLAAPQFMLTIFEFLAAHLVATYAIGSAVIASSSLGIATVAAKPSLVDRFIERAQCVCRPLGPCFFSCSTPSPFRAQRDDSNRLFSCLFNL